MTVVRNPAVVSATVESQSAITPLAMATPTGTLSITLTPSPTPVVPLMHNVSLWVGVATLVGVGASLVAAHWRLKRELAASAERMRTEIAASATQSAKERDQSREQAALDRQHSAGLAHKERITTARRATYTEAASELVRAQTYLGSLSSRNLASLDVDASFNGLIAAVGKIAILGEMETILKSRTLLTMIHRALVRCMAKVLPLSVHKAQIANSKEMYQSATLELNRILAAMTNHNETNNQDQAAFAALQRSFDLNQRTARDHREKIGAANKKLANGKREFIRTVLDETYALNAGVDDLVFCVRAELGLITSREQLRQSSAETMENAEEAIKELFEHVEEFTAAQETDGAPAQAVRADAQLAPDRAN
jgi:hypothetical protein